MGGSQYAQSSASRTLVPNQLGSGQSRAGSNLGRNSQASASTLSRQSQNLPTLLGRPSVPASTMSRRQTAGPTRGQPPSIGFIQEENEFGNVPQDNSQTMVTFGENVPAQKDQYEGFQYGAPSLQCASSQGLIQRGDGATQVVPAGQPEEEMIPGGKRYSPITWRVLRRLLL